MPLWFLSFVFLLKLPRSSHTATAGNASHLLIREHSPLEQHGPELFLVAERALAICTVHAAHRQSTSVSVPSMSRPIVRRASVAHARAPVREEGARQAH